MAELTHQELIELSKKFKPTEEQVKELQGLIDNYVDELRNKKVILTDYGWARTAQQEFLERTYSL